jgi:DNA-binding Lrp family transcriptional regulator
MITAIVLINVDRKYILEIGKQLADIEGVAEAYSVAGIYDFVAIIRVKEHEKLAEIVAGKLAKLDGITKTLTLVAFQCFSKYDLEHMWSLGLSDK